MSDIVFILGAGASRHAGAPLMADFLDTGRRLWSGDLLDRTKDQEAFATVFEGISILQQVHSKSQLDIHNVESVFSAFEMAQILQRYGDYDEESIANLVGSMRSLIAVTLQETVKFPIQRRRGEYRIAPPDRYNRFVKQVKELSGQPPLNPSVSVITFNYDIALDYAFHWQDQAIWYGLSDQDERDRIPVLKLHGSINWAQCGDCEAILPWHLTRFVQENRRYFRRQTMGDPPRSISFPVAYWISDIDLEHCEGVGAKAEPFVVPPTWNKGEGHPRLRPVWSHAARQLAEAHTIIVIGYSLPATDSFFRYLYSLGTVGDVPLRRFWVFNPDDSGSVEERFEDLLGPGAEERFEYFPYGFNQALMDIKDEFALSTD